MFTTFFPNASVFYTLPSRIFAQNHKFFDNYKNMKYTLLKTKAVIWLNKMYRQ